MLACAAPGALAAGCGSPSRCTSFTREGSCSRPARCATAWRGARASCSPPPRRRRQADGRCRPADPRAGWRASLELLALLSQDKPDREAAHPTRTGRAFFGRASAERRAGARTSCLARRRVHQGRRGRELSVAPPGRHPLRRHPRLRRGRHHPDVRAGARCAGRSVASLPPRRAPLRIFLPDCLGRGCAGVSVSARATP